MFFPFDDVRVWADTLDHERQAKAPAADGDEKKTIIQGEEGSTEWWIP